MAALQSGWPRHVIGGEQTPALQLTLLTIRQMLVVGSLVVLLPALVQLKSGVRAPEQTASRVEGDGLASLTRADRHGFMGDDGGGDEHDVARAHLDDELEFVKYDVPAQLGVEVAEDDNGTAAVCQVFEVPVSETVDGHSGKGTITANGIRL